MSNKCKEYISTGTIQIRVGIEKESADQCECNKCECDKCECNQPQTKYLLGFSPDAAHWVSYGLKHKHAVFLERKPSTCSCKNPVVCSIARPLKNGIVELIVENDKWEDVKWHKSLSDCAIKQVKVDVIVNKKLKLIGFQIPAIQSLD